MTATICIAALAMINGDNQMLLVRKRGTQAFMQPGGKIDAGETPLEAVRREVWEELGVDIPAEDLSYVGSFEAPAANEAGARVHAELFRCEADAAVAPAAEIEELLWYPQDDHGTVCLAPLTRDHILPLLEA